jgi:hypothetical protein
MAVAQPVSRQPQDQSYPTPSPTHRQPTGGRYTYKEKNPYRKGANISSRQKCLGNAIISISQRL